MEDEIVLVIRKPTVAVESSDVVSDISDTTGTGSDPITEPCSPMHAEPDDYSKTVQGKKDKKCNEVDPTRTTIIFDWDDTLLPSSWLNINNMRLDDSCIVPHDIRIQLDTLSNVLISTLETAIIFGTVIIVTNAETGWVELSGKKFLPRIVDFFRQHYTRVVSARSMWEPQGLLSPFEWKKRTFLDEIHRGCGGEGHNTNVISLGDSSHERLALLFCSCQLNQEGQPHYSKSIKLVERPSLEQVRKQHTLISDCLPRICTHDAHLDLCVKCCPSP
eukprot:GHVR01010281.1.p1 GENE.GHVR01010281.1~~GHVR01010281.1.p1  ORF type:complete len:291 (-),score=60.75 GHVR01010281.1:132-956(-)